MQFRSNTVTPLFFLCMSLILLTPIKTQFYYYDEGFAVFNATRVMKGDVPYRDFWAIYPPGQSFALAAIFRMFGETLFVARLYDTIVRLIIVVGVYLIGKRTTTYPLALLWCTIATLFLASAGFYAYAVFPALAFGVLSIVSLLEYVNTKKRQWLLVTGMLVGSAMVFRWDIGLYAGTSVVLTITLFHCIRIVQESEPAIKALFATSKLLLIVVVAGLLVVVPSYGYLGFVSGFRNLWAQVVIFPTSMLFEVRWLPYPSIIPSSFPFRLSIWAFRRAYPELEKWLQFYLPLFIYGISFCYCGFSVLRKSLPLSATLIGTIALSILGVLLFGQALSRYDYVHVVPSSIVAFIVATLLVHDVVGSIHNSIIKYCCMLPLICIGVVYFGSPIRTVLNNVSPLGCYSHVSKASCVYLNRDQEQAVEYIRAHTIDDESIFVGNRRHDLIFVNDVGFYFLSNRLSATKYHDLFPGVATTRAVQEVIVHDVESKNVNWIILMNMPQSGEPNNSSVSSGVHYLDDFIRSKYFRVAAFGDYEILEKVIK
jgi:hypothetical protein